MQDSVAHSQMKGTFSTSSYLPAAVAIFSFASLNVELLRPSRSSLDGMPQLIHLRPQEKTFVPKGTARTSPPHERPPEQFGFALLSGISSLSLSNLGQLGKKPGRRRLQTRIWNRNCEKRRFEALLESRLAFWLRRGLGSDIRACACNGIRSRSGLSLARRSLTQSDPVARRGRCPDKAHPR